MTFKQRFVLAKIGESTIDVLRWLMFVLVMFVLFLLLYINQYNLTILLYAHLEPSSYHVHYTFAIQKYTDTPSPVPEV